MLCEINLWRKARDAMSHPDYSLILGYSAAALQLIGMASQLRHSFLTKNYRGLSPVRIATDVITNSFTLSYAAMIRSIPICISSSSVISANLIIGTAYALSRENPPEDTSADAAC